MRVNRSPQVVTRCLCATFLEMPLRWTMANKATNAPVAAKKPGKTLKEKRAAKAVKEVEKTASRKTWENK
jgi:hypothetical protein